MWNMNESSKNDWDRIGGLSQFSCQRKWDCPPLTLFLAGTAPLERFQKRYSAV